MERDLYYELNSITNLTNKVFPMNAPLSVTPPYAIYLQRRADREEELQGHNGLIGGTYEIHVFDTTYSGMKSILNSVVTKVKTFNLRTIGTYATFIQQAKIDNEFESYHDDVELFHGVLEITLYYQE